MFTGKTIGIIGVGSMGEILVRGLLGSKHVDASQIVFTEKQPERRDLIQKTYGIAPCASNTDLVEKSDIVILAIKPQNVDPLLDELSGASHEDHLFISILAGVTTERLASRMHDGTGVIRVMPNSPAFVLAGAAAICPGSNVSDNDLERARAIFDAIGQSVVVRDEKLMDVVTGLSGSGPAYVFMMIESLSDAGVALGLQRKEANALAAQTVFGAGKMYLETGRHTSELRDQVATPGGTTFAGLRMLEKNNFRSTIMEAVEAATERSRELGRKKD